jgi:Bacterial regulatory proteins, luxR family
LGNPIAQDRKKAAPSPEAALIFISEKTVESHRRSIIEKLQLPKEKNILLHFTASLKKN